MSSEKAKVNIGLIPLTNVVQLNVQYVTFAAGGSLSKKTQKMLFYISVEWNAEGSGEQALLLRESGLEPDPLENKHQGSLWISAAIQNCSPTGKRARRLL